jgi:hypothetical protein
MGCDEESGNPQLGPERLSEKERKPPIEGIFDDIFSRGASEEQLEALRVAAAAHKAAQVQLLDAAGVLWNSQVEAAMAIGGPHGASLAMAQRLNFFDNCSCGPCRIVITCW